MNPSRALPPGAFARNLEPQAWTILDSGVGSFEQRLQMIASAQKTLDTEFYIYNDDQPGRLYTQALIAKAKANVKVRVLIDKGINSGNISPHFANVMMSNGIEVRYYNETPLINAQQANHRSHRKSLIVDNRVAILGGRNMAAEYFDFSKTFNFVDRDVVVQGSIVQDVTRSFENFWNSELSRVPKNPPEPQLINYGLQSEQDAPSIEKGIQLLSQYKLDHKNYVTMTENAKQYIVQTPSDGAALERVHQLGQLAIQAATKDICNETYYYADLPGTPLSSRVVQDQINTFAATAQKTISMESPFFILKNGNNLFSSAITNGIKVDILTNSLASAEVPLAIAPFLATAKVLSAQGATVYIHEGLPPRRSNFSLAEAQNARWGTHAKTMLVDDNSVLIGSFNIDPRSANLNAEMALVCVGSKTLASSVAVDFETRKSTMAELGRNGLPLDGRDIHLNASEKARRNYLLTKPFALVFSSFL